MTNRNRKPRFFEKVLFALFILLASAVLFITCYKAPVTGRSQFILISEQEANQMGTAAFQEVLSKESVSNNEVYNEAVSRVAGRITGVSDIPQYNWDYKVFKDDETINAFALPGGKIGVYTGIIPVAESDAGLATVLGHEVAHVAAHHGAERISTGILAQLGAVAIGVALSNRDPLVVDAIMQAYGIGVTVGGILPFSRVQESEADSIGLIYMAKAGYDPSEAIDFWNRMEQATRGKPKPPEFLATHPGYGTRVSNLKKWLPEATKYYERSDKAQNLMISSSH
ncbi:MAG: M48 family metallopeptidase [Candidatus Dadabacteria bacterium]|nr:M48 family metallopeptidase [Candidatus Dadabacteria bacterium]